MIGEEEEAGGEKNQRSSFPISNKWWQTSQPLGYMQQQTSDYVISTNNSHSVASKLG